MMLMSTKGYWLRSKTV